MALRNALRLHFDSITLYKNRRYPSAFFLSIIALEETGKYFTLERLVFHSRIEGRYELELEKSAIKAIYFHKIKQADFVENMGLLKMPFELSNLEVKKQNSLYVGLIGRDIAGKITNPKSFTAGNVKRQVRYLNDCLIAASLKSSIEGCVDESRRVLNIALARKLFRVWPLVSEELRRNVDSVVEQYPRCRIW